MKETQLERKSESKQNEKPNQHCMAKSKFNEQEYQRWSETLRSKSKANAK